MIGVRNTRRRTAAAYIAVLAMIFVALTQVQANAAEQTPPPDSFAAMPTDFADVPLTVDQFDPALGTLTSATVVFDSSVVGVAGVENLSLSSQGTGQINLAADMAWAFDPGVAVADGIAGTNPTFTEMFALAACDTVVDGVCDVSGIPPTCEAPPDPDNGFYGGPAGEFYDGITDSSSTTTVFTDAASLALFTGTGDVTFYVSANGVSSADEDTGNVVFCFVTQAAAGITVTYQFDVAAIDIEKATNGEDADTPTGPQVPVGDPVNWTYVVTNTGDVDLTNVVVTDDQGVTVTCPQDALTVGESMTCTAAGVAALGQYANVGTVTGTAPDESTVTDTDPSHYIGIADDPAIDIEKATNGEDADTPTGPTITVGDPVNWTYVVTNIGNEDLSNVAVVDDQGVAVTCPQDTLAVGETMTCTATDAAVLGQYANIGTVTGDAPDGTPVTDSDPSHYVGETGGQVLVPSIDIEKATNGQDADTPTGPVIGIGDAVNWTYVVTNNGDLDLSSVVVVDNQGVTVTCPQDTLDIDESMTCSASGIAAEGQYANIGTATGQTGGGVQVTDSDPSHYIGGIAVTGAASGRQALFGALILAMGAALLFASRKRASGT